MVAQARGWSRFLVMSLLLHVPLFIYPVLRLCDWLELTWWLTLIILIPIASSQVVSRVYLRTRHGVIPKLLRQAADIFLGASPVFLVTLLAFEILVGLALIAPANAAVGVIMVGTCAGIERLVVLPRPRLRAGRRAVVVHGGGHPRSLGRAAQRRGLRLFPARRRWWRRENSRRSQGGWGLSIFKLRFAALRCRPAGRSAPRF